jgi:hypothetical protein
MSPQKIVSAMLQIKEIILALGFFAKKRIYNIQLTMAGENTPPTTQHPIRLSTRGF